MKENNVTKLNVFKSSRIQGESPARAVLDDWEPRLHEHPREWATGEEEGNHGQLRLCEARFTGEGDRRTSRLLVRTVNIVFCTLINEITYFIWMMATFLKFVIIYISQWIVCPFPKMRGEKKLYYQFPQTEQEVKKWWRESWVHAWKSALNF